METISSKIRGKVVLDISMSLDGYVAGPDIDFDNPMGKGGERLHEWIFSGKTDAAQKMLDDLVQNSGAVILGSHTYKLEVKAWGGVSPFVVPALVLAKNKPETIMHGFTFIADGIEKAISEARQIAGEKNIWIMGGANTAQQFIRARLIDEVYIHLIPVVLSEGARLFENLARDKIELEKTEVIQTAGAIHIKGRLKYE